MRNLKKFLALVLSLAMAFSLMLSAGAVDYKDYQDKDSITPEFTEAVNVLTGLKVMQGDEKGFRPGDSITRAEAAAVIYRAVTGDVTDKQNDLYKDYNHFTDVNSSDWFAGYVGYCQNAGYIKGTTPTTFNPYGKVTGYEALAMILRAVGYGKNNEFTGSSWQVNVAALSRQLGVTRNVTAAHMEQTLNMSAPREVVADLIFMTIATVPTVTYTPALAYNDKQTITSEIYNLTLGQEVFGLFHDTTWQVIDQWGNPGYRWRDKGVWNGTLVTTVTGGKGYMVPANHPWYVASSDTKTVATIEQKADYTTTEQVRECDVAAALDGKGFGSEETFRLYVNQRTSLTDTYRVVATDTVTRVGGQGRLTKVYFEMENPWFTDDTDNHDMVVTMVDTMLALVTNKTACKTDAAGHIITPAQLEVTIYDGMQTTDVAGNGVNSLSNRVITKGSADSSNWDEYSKGDYILLNAYTNKIQSAENIPGNPASGFIAPAIAAAPALGNNVIRDTQAKLEEAAFTTNKVANTPMLYAGTFNTNAPNVWIVDNGKNGIADSIQGKQTVTSWNTGKHTVDGTDYDDQICLFLDRAGRVTNTTFTWFFDQYGNLIGIGDAHAVNYGVITAIYSAQDQGTTNDYTTGGVKAIATVRFADGTTGTVEVDRFLMPYGQNDLPANNATTASTEYFSKPGAALENGGDITVAGGVYAPVGNATPNNQNTVELRPVFDTVARPGLSASAPDPVYTWSDDIAAPGWLYLSPSTATNTTNHFNSTGIDVFGILYNNLFRFTVANDNAVVATQVAGSYANAGGAYDTILTDVGYGNTNPHFTRMANATTSDATSKLFKNLGYMSVTQAAVAAAAKQAAVVLGTNYVYLADDAKIMVKLGDNSVARTINCYNGLSELPGDVEIPTGTEIDWTDIDGDGRADVVYIANGNMPSTITYGLFYYDGGTAIWDGATGTGTIAGYLNGDAETITFTNRTQFNTVQSSANYAAHLFALQFTNGNVSNVMRAENKSSDVITGAKASQRILTVEGSTYYDEAGTAVTSGNATGVVLDFHDATKTNAPANRAENIQLSGSTITWDATNSATTTKWDQTFGLGAAFKNPYNNTTEAIYVRDLTGTTPPTATNGISHVTYARDSMGRRIVANYWDYNAGTPIAVTKSFYLAPNCKIVGELDWLNNTTLNCDVTLVYDTAAADAVTEVYISRDQDITPVVPEIALGSTVIDLSDLPSINSASALDTALKALPSGSIAYMDSVKAQAGWINSNPEDIVYFTYTTTSASQTVSVEIRDAAGTLRYYESTAPGAAKSGYFGVNINPATVPNTAPANQACWANGLGLTAGTYTCTITVGGVAISKDITVSY